MVVERAAGDSISSAREWRAALIRLFHDFRPEDDTRVARRPHPLRAAGCGGSSVRPIPALSHQRAALEPGRYFAAGADTQPGSSRSCFLMATEATPDCFSEIPITATERN